MAFVIASGLLILAGAVSRIVPVDVGVDAEHEAEDWMELDERRP